MTLIPVQLYDFIQIKATVCSFMYLGNFEAPSKYITVSRYFKKRYIFALMSYKTCYTTSYMPITALI